MCLVAVALGTSREMPLVIAANRDEYFARPSARAAWWKHEGVEIFGGRDLEKGGTWLGLTRAGRVALVTNVRDPSARADGRASRGWLVRDALAGAVFPPVLPSDGYPTYNLLVGEGGALYYLRDDASPEPVSPGHHALSNHRLDTPWPKVTAATRALATVNLGEVEALFRILADDALAPDHELPATGVPLEVERALSPPFVRLPLAGYGTRCSTVVRFHGRGKVDFEERTFDASGKLAGTVRAEMELPSEVHVRG